MTQQIMGSTDIENLQYNPFLHDLILDILFCHLPFDELKNCRLVCRTWYHKATRALQQHNRFIVFACLHKINMFQIRPDLESIKLFMHAMEKSENVPYVNFGLRPNMFATQNKSLLDDFLLLYGSFIQRLTINLAYESEDIFPEDCFPNVKFTKLLELEFCNNSRGELRPSLKTPLLTTRKNLFSTILSTACNLQSIVLWADNENLVWPGEVFDVLCSQKLNQLKNLKISLPCNDSQLGRLENFNAHLTSLIFVLRNPLMDTTPLTKILESQAKTLKVLKIIDLQCDHTKEIRLPVMERITHFTLEGTFYGDDSMISFSKFSYKLLPKLINLDFICCNEHNMDIQQFFSNTPCFTLKELQTELRVSCVNTKLIRQIPKSFPNLRKIRVFFSLESKHLLADLFESLISLEEMTLDLRKCANVNLDDLITGFPRNVCDDNLKNMDESSSLELLKLNDGISTLTNLKCLIVVGEYKNYKPEEFAFTDKSLFFGLLNLPKLKYIRMWKSGFSDTGLRILRNDYHFIEPATEN